MKSFLKGIILFLFLFSITTIVTPAETITTPPEIETVLSKQDQQILWVMCQQQHDNIDKADLYKILTAIATSSANQQNSNNSNVIWCDGDDVVAYGLFKIPKQCVDSMVLNNKIANTNEVFDQINSYKIAVTVMASYIKRYGFTESLLTKYYSDSSDVISAEKTWRIFDDYYSTHVSERYKELYESDMIVYNRFTYYKAKYVSDPIAYKKFIYYGIESAENN